MIIRVTAAQARAILGSMRSIALTRGASTVSDADSPTIEAVAAIVPGLAGGVPPGLAPCPPDALARAIFDDADDAAQAVPMLAVMSLAGARIDPGKITLVQEYADALGVRESHVQVLAEAAAGEIAATSACMIGKNVPDPTWRASTPMPSPRSFPAAACGMPTSGGGTVHGGAG